MYCICSVCQCTARPLCTVVSATVKQRQFDWSRKLSRVETHSAHKTHINIYCTCQRCPLVFEGPFFLILPFSVCSGIGDKDCCPRASAVLPESLECVSIACQYYLLNDRRAVNPSLSVLCKSLAVFVFSHFMFRTPLL